MIHKFRLLLFPPYVIFAHPFFFFKKCPCDFQILEFKLSFPIVMWWKKCIFTNSDFIIRKPQNRVRSLIFSDSPKHHFLREKQFGLYNLNCISINSEHVCNMNNLFKDHINLSNFHLYVFRSLLVALDQKSGFSRYLIGLLRNSS